ncbi:hypothetical protein HMP0721_2438 [Pseudoramibacter alactolyticus ATCC 23263]|uniref:Uncharacterized protein n=1 Tax=Pseudoramibacter alactolyticus ATCC 23263 TaxID=887929 RepID=E6MKA2_9FIRM|nr:hypothetical protein HMP0721_2438 [Pseudoramibacter alactolyticus ATCC 23263]
MKRCMHKKIGGRHTNRTDNSVSVCILSTDGQAALRIKKIFGCFPTYCEDYDLKSLK